MSSSLRFELSSLELSVLVREINASLPRYVSQIYRGLDGSYIFRLTGREDVRDLRIIPGKGIFLAPGVFQTHGEIDELASVLRRHVRGHVLRNVERIEGERVVILRFERGASRLSLVAELFPGGGLSLLDEGEMVITSTSLRRGERYSPPARRLTVSSRDEALAALAKIEGKLKLGVALARELGLGTKYSNEVVERAGVDPSKKVFELSSDEKERLANAIETIFKLLETPQPTVYKTGEASTSFAPFPLTHMERKGLQAVATSSLNDAVSSAYESYLRSVKLAERRKTLEEEVKRLEREIAEKRALIEQLKSRALQLRETADALYLRLAELKDCWDEVKRGKIDIPFVKSVDRSAGLVTIQLDGREVRLNLSEPITRQVNGLFKDAKTTMTGVENLLKEVAELERRLNQLKASQPVSEQEEKIEVRRRGTEWFHRFRWSMTSSGRLIVLGRDAISNIRLLKNHTSTDDLVFHAEVKGSPVAILKGGADAGEAELLEAANLCASFSRAWREGLSSVTVFWVRPQQISFTPPPGMYLPRGSFIVQPPKNYIQASLEICVGYSERLGPIVGSEAWMRSEALVYAVITPGSEEAATLARALLARVEVILGKKEEELKLSDFERLVPYGKCRVLRWSG